VKGVFTTCVVSLCCIPLSYGRKSWKLPNIRPKPNIWRFFAAKYSVLAKSQNSCFSRTLETTDSEEIRPDESVKDAGAMEEGNQIPLDPGPYKGRAGQSGVGARTGVTRDATTAHLVSDDQESEDTSSVGLSKRLRTSPRKKGKFDEKEHDDTDSDCSRNCQLQVSQTFRLMYRRLAWGMMIRGMSSD
jgi:hypothetical protein